MMMAASTIAPMAMAMPPSDMMFEVRCEPEHRDERENDRNWQRDDRDQRGADVPEENEADQRDDDAFFDQFFAQRRDGALDQLAAIVGRDDLAPRPAATI